MLKRTLIVLTVILLVIFVPYFIGEIPFLNVDGVWGWFIGFVILYFSVVGTMALIVLYHIAINYIKNGN